MRGCVSWGSTSISRDRVGGWLRLQADRVHGNHAVGVLLAGFGLGVGELHWHERLRGRVAVLQVLKDGATERVLALLGHVGEELAVTLDDETGQSAFEIGFGLPAQFVAAARAGSSAREAVWCRSPRCL